jgi:hypothetical protein
MSIRTTDVCKIANNTIGIYMCIPDWSIPFVLPSFLSFFLSLLLAFFPYFFFLSFFLSSPLVFMAGA